jgi:hypothetical protein
MLATGGAAVATIDILQALGVTKIKLSADCRRGSGIPSPSPGRPVHVAAVTAI